MAWNSLTFIASMTASLSKQQPNISSFANELALAYSISAKTASPKTPVFASLPVSLKPSSIIAQGFIDSMNLAFELDSSDPDSSIWLPASNAIISYWTGVIFSPLPPPPGGGIGTTNIIVFAGEPNQLAENITNAFKGKSPPIVATQLNFAFLTHLSSIKGLWTGFAVAGAPPPPFVLPWSGLI